MLWPERTDYHLVWVCSSPVLSQHRQALQEDGHDRLVQVGSRREGLQIHLLLGALLCCATLLILHYSLGTVNVQETISTE